MHVLPHCARSSSYIVLEYPELALNFEAGGSGGPAEMYMTSQQNGWLINEYLQAAPAPLASSFLNNLAWVFSAQRLGCDLEEYMARGSAGLDLFPWQKTVC